MGFQIGNERFVQSNPRKKYFRCLTNEEIDRIAKKTYNIIPIEPEDPKNPTPEEVAIMRLMNGEETEEGRKRSLRNLRPPVVDPKKAKKKGKGIPATHGGTIHDLLNEDEREFYKERKTKYISDFDLNESSDEAILTMVLMEEVIWRRLMLYQAERPSADVSKQLNGVQKRLVDSLKALGMTRDQRQGQRINVEHSVADLAARVAIEIGDAEVIAQEKMREEAELLRKKKEREENTVEAEYEEIEDASSGDASG